MITRKPYQSAPTTCVPRSNVWARSKASARSSRFIASTRHHQSRRHGTIGATAVIRAPKYYIDHAPNLLHVRVSVDEPRCQTRDDAHRAQPQGGPTPTGGEGVLDAKDGDDGHGEGQAVDRDGHIHGYVVMATEHVDAKQDR